MPDIDKNIIITPNRGATLQPNIVFTGQGVDPITVRVLDGTTGTGLTAGGALSFEGSAGQLFSVVNRLGTGSIFSVNDISGIPSLDVDANGTVEIAPFTGYVAIGLTLPTEKLHVLGNIRYTGGLCGGTAIFSSDIRASGIRVGIGGGNITTNTSLGLDALNSNTTGSNNTAVGSNSLRLNTTGFGNVGVGRRSFFSLVSGNNNIAIGSTTLVALQQGDRNIAIGSESASGVNTGTGNICIGVGTSINDNTTNQIVIGDQAVGLGSNTTVIGTPSHTQASIHGQLNALGGISAPGATIYGNINLQNGEFIRNSTNGRIDIMPSPGGSTHYGIYIDPVFWGFGTRIGTIRSSDNALDVAAFLFYSDCVLQGSRTFSMEQSQTIKFLASGPDSGNNNTLQVTVSQDSGRTGNAFVLMDANSTGYGSTRVPNANFPNPNFFIYSGTNTRNNANDFIRFEHNLHNGRVVSGGTSGINLEPGSGIVGISGGVSAGAFILNSSGIKSLTGTTYTFLASDNGDVLTHDNASGCTLTIPTGLPVGFSTTVIRLNSAGTVRFVAGSGVTLNSFANYTTLAGQHASASLISYTTNIYNLAGNLS